MRAQPDPSSSPSAPGAARPVVRRFRLAFCLVCAGAAAWGAGCSDDPPATPSETPDGGPAPDTYVPPPPEDAAPPGRDCTGDRGDDGIWTHLECSGLYSSFADKTVAADVKPYKPAYEFWSDGAEKQRWVYFPDGAKIDISDWDEWTFPNGTKLWKEFKLGGKRIETRLFTKLDDGSWAHTVYRWNADESDAVAVSAAESVPGIGPDGGTYEIPSPSQCEQCHFGRKDRLLGFDAVSLGLPGATGQTLATLAAEGRLSATPPETSLELPGGSTPANADKARAAVGWLHANCGACHNANDGAAASFTPIKFLIRADHLAPIEGGAAATLEQLPVYDTGYCKESLRGDPDGAPGAKYIYLRGTEPERSLVSILSGRRVAEGENPTSSVQMPPIVTRAVDIEGHAQLDEWITSLPACP